MRLPMVSKSLSLFSESGLLIYEVVPSLCRGIQKRSFANGGSTTARAEASQAPRRTLRFDPQMGTQEHSNRYTKRYTFSIRRAQSDGINGLQRRRKELWRGMQESNLRPPVS